MPRQQDPLARSNLIAMWFIADATEVLAVSRCGKHEEPAHSAHTMRFELRRNDFSPQRGPVCVFRGELEFCQNLEAFKIFLHILWAHCRNRIVIV
jgi:hypothetical protein